MNLKMKLRKLVEVDGIDREEAMKIVLEEAQKTINDYDQKLSKSFEFLRPDQIKEVVGDLTK